ncbi:phage tail tip fiber protein [Pseudomonas sp. B392_1p]|uniref:phage tail tip fiber protein n=1 Tax=Pseudomonas sp. B392_1p TaxID=3457507 RepID=UPI003FD68967
MTKRRKTLPPLSAKVPAELRPLMAAMTEILETGEGVRGDKLDRKLTLRDLLEGGVAKLRVPGNPDAGVVPPSQLEDRTVPPRPTGFSALGSFFGMINLSWDRPQELYNNHALTNIYRAEEDNFALAEVVGRDAGAFYSDLVRNDATVVDDPLNLPGFYYWITFSSSSEVEGPPNSPNGIHAQPLPDAKYLLAQLSEKLGASELEQTLRKRIDLIDAPASTAGSVAARVEAEREERIEQAAALAREIVTLFSRWESASAAIQRVDEARASGEEALARSIQQVQTVSGENAATIKQQAESINGLSAQATLTLDVNGHVSGVGSYNDGRKASFAVLADEFWIATPGKPDSAVKPYMLVDGVNYMDVAFIREGSIQEGHLGPITFGKIHDAAGNPVTTVAGKLRADMLDVDKLQVGDGNISGVLKSNQVDVQGRPRWMLDKNGGMTLNGSGGGVRIEIGDMGIRMWYPNGRLMARMGPG